MFDGFLLEDLRAMVRTALARDGYLRAGVTDRIEQHGSGASAEKTIVLSVTPGPASATRRIAFRGNTRVTADQLGAALRARDLDLEAWLDPAKAESTLTALYRGAGSLDATVHIGAPEFDGGTATLPVVIDEGPLFHVAGVRVEGAHGLSDAAVRKAFGVAAGAAYVYARIEDGRQRVEQAYRHDGFAEARVVVTSDVTREAAEVALDPRRAGGAAARAGRRQRRGRVGHQPRRREPRASRRSRASRSIPNRGTGRASASTTRACSGAPTSSSRRSARPRPRTA